MLIDISSTNKVFIIIIIIIITLQSVTLKEFLPRVFVMPFSTSSPLTTTLNMKFKKALITPGHSGTFEHTAQMADIINKARTKQR